MRQSRPNSGFGCQVKVLKTFQLVPATLGIGGRVDPMARSCPIQQFNNVLPSLQRFHSTRMLPYITCLTAWLVLVPFISSKVGVNAFLPLPSEEETPLQNQGLSPERLGPNLALTVSHVTYLLDSRVVRGTWMMSYSSKQDVHAFLDHV